MQKFERAFLSDRAGISILDFLADELPLSKSKIKDAMQKGAVWLHREGQDPERVRKSKEAVKLGDDIHIYYDESFLNIKLPKFQCIDTQGQYSIWHKPFGLMSEVTLYGDHLSLERVLERDLPRHIDCYFIDPEQADISGLMIAAHTQVAASKLFEQQQKQQIIKDYQITIVGKLSDSALSLTLGDSQQIFISLESYNAYNDTSNISITGATGYEDQILESLCNEGLNIFDDEELVCSRITFTSPIDDQDVEYTV